MPGTQRVLSEHHFIRATSDWPVPPKGNFSLTLGKGGCPSSQEGSHSRCLLFTSLIPESPLNSDHRMLSQCPMGNRGLACCEPLITAHNCFTVSV